MALVGRGVTEVAVREMELRIMKAIGWKLNFISPAEISFFLIKIFWIESLQKDPSTIPQDLQVCVLELVRTGSVLERCLNADYLTFGVTIVVSTLEIIDIPTRDKFILWANQFVQLSTVGMSLTPGFD
jgi:hypothetical protein